MSNPYTLVFGQSPVEIIERKSQSENIISTFSSDRPSNYLNLVTGIRGVGKTVFISSIAKHFEKQKDWIVVNLNPKRDLLKGLAATLYSDQKVNLWIKEAKINLSFFGFGVEIKGEPQIVDIEVALNKILHTIKKNNKRLLITIDEVSNTKDMRVFASSYQLFLREDLPVFLLMSGLYKNIDALRNADGMTFLERAPRTMLSSLKMDAIADNYSRIIGLPMDRSMRLAQASKGYSFAFQTIGYFVWENTDNIDKGLLEAREYLYEFSYNKIWSELSSKDKLFVYAMAVASSNEVIAIRRQLNYTSNQFNPYRDRMIKAGVVYSEHNGLLDFALPWFGEYAIMKHEHMENLE